MLDRHLHHYHQPLPTRTTTPRSRQTTACNSGAVSFFSTAAERATLTVPVRTSPQASILLADTVNTQLLLTRRGGD